MGIENTTAAAPGERTKRHRTSKLESPAVADLIREMVAIGATLSEIRSALAQSTGDRPAIEISRSAIHNKVRDLGLELAAAPFKDRIEPPSPEAIAAARRDLDKDALRDAIRKGPGRNPSWLKSFEPDIQILLGLNLTLRQIYEELARRYGHICPQLASPLTDKQKSNRIGDFIQREARKAVRSKKRTNWAQTYLEAGRLNRAVSPATPMPTANSGPADIPARAHMQKPGTAKSINSPSKPNLTSPILDNADLLREHQQASESERKASDEGVSEGTKRIRERNAAIEQSRIDGAQSVEDSKRSIRGFSTAYSVRGVKPTGP